jgi:hypothetical protein
MILRAVQLLHRNLDDLGTQMALHDEATRLLQEIDGDVAG